MTAFILTMIAVIVTILTVWLVVIPAGMVVGGLMSFRHDHGWKRALKH